jgi:hypothetical protein
MRGTMFAIWGANRSGSMPSSMRPSWTSTAPQLPCDRVRVALPERTRRRATAAAWDRRKAVDIRAITTSELEFSAPIDTEYSELTVRTLHTLYALDAQDGGALRRGGPNPWYTSLERRMTMGSETELSWRQRNRRP